MNVGFYTPPASRERDLFIAARQKPNPLERQRFLDHECQDDAALRARVEELLRSESDLGEFLEGPALADLETRAATSAQDSCHVSVAAADENLGDRIGRYKLISKISEGGVGVVYLAEQEEPVRRRVAVKVIKRGMDTENVIARFEAERQALAMMDHPNIAKVLDAGATEAGRPFFVMELVHGVSITEYCDQSRLSTTERLNLFIKVCQAVQHAHQKGIIHRDIKPSNILVAMQDTHPVPKVIDFGIAKAIEQPLAGSGFVTSFHSFVGTPAYASPEQAGMAGLDIDTRTDIYSLGVLLHELLTGCTPFDPQQLTESGLDGMRRTICEEEPLRPSMRLAALSKSQALGVVQSRRERLPQLAASLRGDLDCIVLKCIEKDRTRRYATANALAMEIQRHLDGEPVLARPPSTAYRLRKYAQRHRVAFAATVAVGLALIVGTVVSVKEAMRAAAAEEAAQSALVRADSERGRAEREKYKARINEYVYVINLAQHALESGNFGRAGQLLQEQRPRPGSSDPDLRGWEWRYLWSLSQGDARTELPVQPDNPKSVYSFASSSDGQYLAVGLADAVLIWETATQSRVTALPVPGRSLVFLPNSPTLVTSGPAAVQLWRMSDWTERGSLPNSCSPVAISADGTLLVAARLSGGATLWNVSTLKEARTWPAAQGPFAFSPDGRMLAGDTADGRGLRLWALGGTEREVALQASEGLFGDAWLRSARVLMFTRDSKRVIAARRVEAPRRISILQTWDATSGASSGTFPENIEAAHTGFVSALDLSPDGRTLATASWDHSIRLWDLEKGTHLATINGHAAEVWSLFFANQGQSLGSAAKDGAVNIWPIGPKAKQEVLEGPWRPIRFARESPVFAALNPNGNVSILDLDTHELKTELPVRNPRAASQNTPSIALSDNLQVMAQAHRDGSVSIWDVPSGESRTLQIPRRNVSSVTLTSDGSMLVAGGWDGRLRWWNVSNLLGSNTPIELAAIQAPASLISMDGGTLVAFDPLGTGRSTIQVWDVATHYWRTNVVIDASARNVRALSTDGRFLATTPGVNDVDNSVYLWDLITGDRVGAFVGHKQPVHSVAFSPDRRTLASASDDGTVKLWHIVTHQELMTLPHLGGLVGSLMFSPDGQFLVSESRSGPASGVRVFRAPLLDRIDRPETGVASEFESP